MLCLAASHQARRQGHQCTSHAGALAAGGCRGPAKESTPAAAAPCSKPSTHLPLRSPTCLPVLQEIFSIVVEHLADLDSINITAALQRLAKVCALRRGPAGGRRGVVGSVQRGVLARGPEGAGGSWLAVYLATALQGAYPRGQSLLVVTSPLSLLPSRSCCRATTTTTPAGMADTATAQPTAMP